MPITDGDARVVVFDVGKGLSVLVQTRRHALMFDTGPGSRRWSIATSQIVASLRTLGVGNLDVLMGPHADSGHAGGTDAILSSVPVTRLFGDSGDTAWGVNSTRVKAHDGGTGMVRYLKFCIHWEAKSCCERARKVLGQVLAMRIGHDVSAVLRALAQQRFLCVTHHDLGWFYIVARRYRKGSQN